MVTKHKNQEGGDWWRERLLKQRLIVHGSEEAAAAEASQRGGEAETLRMGLEGVYQIRRLVHSQAKYKSTTGSEPAHGVQPVLITRRQSRDSHLSLYSGGVLHRERFNSATAGTCECSHLCDVSGWSC